MKKLLAFLLEQGSRAFSWQGVSISVLDNPKPALLDVKNQEFVDSLVDKLQVITAESFGMELENQTSDGVRNHVVNVDSLAFLHDQDEVLGFASSKLFREDGIFYLHGVAIAKCFKNKGGGTALTQTLLRRSELERISFTTQNPIMFCLLRKLCSKVYPCPESVVVPDGLRSLGAKLINGRCGSLDPTSFVVSQLYGRCLYSSIPDCNDAGVNRWFAHSLQVEDGLTRNAFLFIGDRKA